LRNSRQKARDYRVSLGKLETDPLRVHAMDEIGKIVLGIGDRNSLHEFVLATATPPLTLSPRSRAQSSMFPEQPIDAHFT
jgi:hypothetical protein